MALIFPRVPIVFTLSSYEGLFIQNMKMQLFGNDVIFFLIVCLSVQ